MPFELERREEEELEPSSSESGVIRTQLMCCQKPQPSQKMVWPSSSVKLQMHRMAPVSWAETVDVDACGRSAVRLRLWLKGIDGSSGIKLGGMRGDRRDSMARLSDGENMLYHRKEGEGWWFKRRNYSTLQLHDNSVSGKQTHMLFF